MRDRLLPMAWRFLRARPLRAFLGALSIALGVGLLVALLTLDASMQKALDLQLARTLGTYDVMVGYRKPNTRLSAADLAVIARTAGVTDVAGILMPYAYEGRAGAHQDLSYYGVPATPLGRQFMAIDSGIFPGPGEVALSAAWAKREGYKLGDTVTLSFPPGPDRQARISGWLVSIKRVGTGFAVFDQTWLAEATGRHGATFALVETAKGADPQPMISRLQAQFPDLEYDLRKFRNEMRRNMDALRPVALGMGIAALVAAAFLLIASFRMSLAERVRELALLRAVGATPGQIRRLSLAEGALLGLPGCAAGVLLGIFGAMLASGTTARLLQVEPVPTVIPWGRAAMVGVAGIALTLLSARGVAGSAARTEPLRALRPDLPAEGRAARQGGLFGLILIGVGAAMTATIPFLPDEPLDGALPPLAGSTGALAVALGLLLGMQRLLPFVLPALAWPFRHRPEGAVAVRNLLRHRRRAGLSVGALGLGLILVLSIGTMGTSLVGTWYEQVHREHPADVQLEVPWVIRRGVSPQLAAEVAAVPGVTVVATVSDPVEAMVAGNRQVGPHLDFVRLHTGDLPALIQIGAYRVSAGAASPWAQGSLAVSSRTAKELGLKVGDRLTLNIAQ